MAHSANSPLKRTKRGRLSPDAFALLEALPGLRDHALQQAARREGCEAHYWAFASLAEHLDSRGYLTNDSDSWLRNAQAVYKECSVNDTHKALVQLQQCDPVGVGAESLEQCLILQLKGHTESHTVRLASHIISEYLAILAQHDYAGLAKKCRASAEDISASCALTRSLNPAPGKAFNADTTRYIAADVLTTARNGTICAQLNPKLAPMLFTTPVTATGSKQAASIQAVKNARKWVESLNARHETLLAIASYLCHAQCEFFKHGAQALKPLTLTQASEALNIHISNLSRSVNGKYMETPQGVVELRALFTQSSQAHQKRAQQSHSQPHKEQTVHTDAHSGAAIKAQIKILIASETRHKPLSDQTITTTLSCSGVSIARRTVAKYREQLRIPASPQRKRVLQIK